MNYNMVLELLNSYKRNFNRINVEESYKWRAVKKFRDTWNPQDINFFEMLSEALSETGNLLEANNFYIRSSILRIANVYPELVRAAFKELYDESLPVIHRIDCFLEQSKNWVDNVKNDNLLPGSAQTTKADLRATTVFLFLRYPEKYYLYKYDMAKEFIAMVNDDLHIKMGHTGSVLAYMELCSAVNEIIREDSELCLMHFKRLNSSHYVDDSFHLLTQDFIYSCTKHLTEWNELPAHFHPIYEEPEIFVMDYLPETEKLEINLQGKFTDYEKKNAQNCAIGRIGEHAVFEYLKRTYGDKAKVYHDSQIKGDGLGYDIRIKTDNQIIFIEVKSTTGNAVTPFYFTANELEKSKNAGEAFQLWRVYYLNRTTNFFRCNIYKGSLETLTSNPVNYYATLK